MEWRDWLHDDIWPTPSPPISFSSACTGWKTPVPVLCCCFLLHDEHDLPDALPPTRPTRSRHDARRTRREESITRRFFLWQQLISSSDPLLSSMNNSVRCHGNGHLSPWKWGYSNLYIKSLCSSNAANVGTWFSPFDAKTLGRVRCCCFDRQESEFWVLHHPSTSCWCLQHTHIKVDTPTLLLLLHGAQTALQSWRLFWWSVFTILINSKSTTCIPNRATHIEHTVS